MKTYIPTLHTANWWLPFAAVLVAGTLSAAGAVSRTSQSSSATITLNTSGSASSEPEAVTLSAPEPSAGDESVAHKEKPWLGVSVEEGSEALAAQLDLAPGAGLVVTYVAPDSPAAKVGLEKNDVLVELDSQLLVVPAQFKKLIEVRKTGDTIKLVYYRAGKKRDVSATLGKAPAEFGLFESRHAWDGEPGQWVNPFTSDAFRQQMKVLRDSVGNVKIDTSKVQEEVRRGLEQARKAMQEALRSSSNAASGAAAKALRELERELQRSRIDLDNNASVTVRSTGHRVKSAVKTDESGTIVIVCNPTPRLTAHDKEGKLLFDGEIATPEERAKVPPELWEKVEPLLDKVAPKAEEEPETDPVH